MHRLRMYRTSEVPLGSYVLVCYHERVPVAPWGGGRQACRQYSDAITPVVGRVLIDDVCVYVESDVEIIFFCPFQSYSGVTKFRRGQFHEQFQKVISPFISLGNQPGHMWNNLRKVGRCVTGRRLGHFWVFVDNLRDETKTES